MRKKKIYARYKRSSATRLPPTRSTDLPVAEKLLTRNSTPTAPNQVWMSDIVTDALSMA